MCLVDGCSEKIIALGYCEKHYRRFKKYGDPLVLTKRKYKSDDLCLVEGCKNKPYGNYLCEKHYKKQKKYGSPIAGKERSSEKYGEYCVVDGCKNKEFSLGYCRRHYEKKRKFGSPLIGRTFASNKGKVCRIENCNEPMQASGLCIRHYRNEYNHSEKGKEISRSNSSRRRAQKRGVEAESFEHKEIFERDKWKCGLCGKPVNKRLKHPDPKSASLDHIVPLSRGGKHVRSNVQLAHLRCNLQKQNKLPKELKYANVR